MTDSVVEKTYPAEVMNAIAEIMASDLYVQKRGSNKFHGYKYATVGDLLDKIQPLMAKHGLVVLQSERTKDFVDGGNVLAIDYEFTLAHKSGAVWPDRPVITGMTSCRNSKAGFDDKSANKCHTAARKYFLLGLFQVPTGEDYREPLHDGDADAQEDQPPPPAISRDEIDQYESDLKPKLAAVLSLNDLDDLWKAGVSAKLREIGSVDKIAQNRMISAFSARKNELLKIAEQAEAQPA